MLSTDEGGTYATADGSALLFSQKTEESFFGLRPKNGCASAKPESELSLCIVKLKIIESYAGKNNE